MTQDEKDAGTRGLTDAEVAERVAAGLTNPPTPTSRQVRGPDPGRARPHPLQRREPRARAPGAAHGPVPQHALHVRGGRQPRDRRDAGDPRQAHGGQAHDPHAEGGHGHPRLGGAHASALRARRRRPHAARPRRPGPRRRRHRLRQRLHEREPAHRRGEARLQGPGRRAALGELRRRGQPRRAREVRGAEGYAARINAEAKYVKAVRSEIQTTLKAIIRLGTVVLVPLGWGCSCEASSWTEARSTTRSSPPSPRSSA